MIPNESIVLLISFRLIVLMTGSSPASCYLGTARHLETSFSLLVSVDFYSFA